MTDTEESFVVCIDIHLEEETERGNVIHTLENYFGPRFAWDPNPEPKLIRVNFRVTSVKDQEEANALVESHLTVCLGVAPRALH